jgi:hypothetical protein
VDNPPAAELAAAVVLPVARFVVVTAAAVAMQSCSESEAGYCQMVAAAAAAELGPVNQKHSYFISNNKQTHSKICISSPPTCTERSNHKTLVTNPAAIDTFYPDINLLLLLLLWLLLLLKRLLLMLEKGLLM